MGTRKDWIRLRCKRPALIIGSEMGTDTSLYLITQRKRIGGKKKKSYTRKPWALTVVSHASIAASLAMLRQSFLGTILTLRYFWQSDYESLCSNVVGALKWTKSPTAVKTWLAVMFQDEEWTAYIKLVSSLLMDSLSAAWWCQDCASGAKAVVVANR